MVDKKQVELLRKLKALLDSGAITEEEFAQAKKRILAESAASPITSTKSVPPKNLRMLGIIGIVALIMPWEIVYLGAVGITSLRWTLFALQWSGNIFAGFFSILEVFPEFMILDLSGFALVLAGSILLLRQNKLGRMLLIGSFAVWIITYACYFLINEFPISIPIGALICGIVGLISYFKR